MSVKVDIIFWIKTQSITNWAIGLKKKPNLRDFLHKIDLLNNSASVFLFRLMLYFILFFTFFRLQKPRPKSPWEKSWQKWVWIFPGRNESNFIFGQRLCSSSEAVVRGLNHFFQSFSFEVIFFIDLYSC